MAFIFNNIGMSYEALADFDRAIKTINRAKTVAEKAKLRPRVENSLAFLGELELKRSHPAQVQMDFEASRQLAVELRDVAGEAQAIFGLAKVDRARGKNESALEQARHAAELFLKLGETVHHAAALTLSGQILEKAQREEEARAAFEEAIAAIETVRQSVAGGDQEREAFFAQEIAPYHELIALLVRQNKGVEALAIAERASARVLLDVSAAGQAEMSAVLSDAEKETHRALELKLAQAERELARRRQRDQREV